jgi:hypothetical protein
MALPLRQCLDRTRGGREEETGDWRELVREVAVVVLCFIPAARRQAPQLFYYRRARSWLSAAQWIRNRKKMAW